LQLQEFLPFCFLKCLFFKFNKISKKIVKVKNDFEKMSKYALLLITLFVMGSFSQRGGKLGDGKGPDPVFKPDDPEECEFECTS